MDKQSPRIVAHKLLKRQLSWPALFKHDNVSFLSSLKQTMLLNLPVLDEFAPRMQVAVT